MREVKSISSRLSSSEIPPSANPISSHATHGTSLIRIQKQRSASSFRRRAWLSTARKSKLRFGIPPARNASVPLHQLITVAQSEHSSSTISLVAPLSRTSVAGSMSSTVCFRSRFDSFVALFLWDFVGIFQFE